MKKCSPFSFFHPLLPLYLSSRTGSALRRPGRGRGQRSHPHRSSAYWPRKSTRDGGRRGGGEGGGNNIIKNSTPPKKKKKSGEFSEMRINNRDNTTNNKMSKFIILFPYNGGFEQVISLQLPSADVSTERWRKPGWVHHRTARFRRWEGIFSALLYRPGPF